MHYDRDAGEEGRAALQRDLDKLNGVAGSWNLSLNIGKCVVMRFSRKFVGWNDFGNEFEYKIGGSALEVVKRQRDLVILVDSELKFHCHVAELVKKTAGLSNNLLRSTVNRSPEFMVGLFISHIRPILDYCSCVWNVGYEGDLDLLEAVQRRWKKNITGIENLSYGEGLRFLNLFSIRGKLLRADLIK